MDHVEHKPRNTAIACASCRRRKIRCDSKRPQCDNCLNFNEYCEYRRTPRQHLSASSLSEALTRLSAVEEKVSSLVSEKELYPTIRTEGETKQSPSKRRIQREPSSFQKPGKETIKNISKPYAAMPPSNPIFNDRLADFKAQLTGAQEYSSAMYISGLFFILLGPKEIEKISTRLFDSFFMDHLEYASHNIWLKTQSFHAQLVQPLWQTFPHATLLEHCKSIFIENFDFYPLLTAAEVESENLSEIPGQQDECRWAIHAAFIIVGCIKLREKDDESSFPRSVIHSQETTAYYHAIKIITLMKFSAPSFGLLRIAALLWKLLYDNTAAASLRLLLRILLDTSKALGLNNEMDEPVGNLPSQRCTETTHKMHVVRVLSSFEYSISISMSLEPCLWSGDVFSFSMSLPAGHEFIILRHAMGLHDIYGKSRRLLFSLPTRRVPIQEIHHLVRELGHAIIKWKEEVPEHIWNYQSSPGSSEECSFLTWHELRSQYYHTLIAIHSITAFNPECFPDQSQISLSQVTEAARQLLNGCLRAQTAKRGLTLPDNGAITAALCVFLYKQVCYPGDLSIFVDVGYIRDFMSKFTNLGLWPEDSEEVPAAETWRIIVNTMTRIADMERLKYAFSPFDQSGFARDVDHQV